jgi:hypothetical protein
MTERLSRILQSAGHSFVLPLTRAPLTAYDATDSSHTGRSAAWLARLPWEQEATGSNPVAPILFTELNLAYAQLLGRSGSILRWSARNRRRNSGEPRRVLRRISETVL